MGVLIWYCSYKFSRLLVHLILVGRGRPTVSSEKQNRHNQEGNHEHVCRDVDNRAPDRCLLRSRTDQRWVKAGDDKMRTAANIDRIDDLPARNIEHGYIASLECYEAQLPIAGDSD